MKCAQPGNIFLSTFKNSPQKHIWDIHAQFCSFPKNLQKIAFYIPSKILLKNNLIIYGHLRTIWLLASIFRAALSLSLSPFSFFSRSLCSLSVSPSLPLQDTRPPKYAMLLDENVMFLLSLSLSLLSLSFAHTLSLPLLPLSFSLSLCLFKTHILPIMRCH